VELIGGNIELPSCFICKPTVLIVMMMIVVKEQYVDEEQRLALSGHHPHVVPSSLQRMQVFEGNTIGSHRHPLSFLGEKNYPGISHTSVTGSSNVKKDEVLSECSAQEILIKTGNRACSLHISNSLLCNISLRIFCFARGRTQSFTFSEK